MKYALFALLSFLCLATLSPAMELPQAPGTIIAEPTRKVSSLKKQAARSFCHAMHPDNRTLPLDQVLKLAAQAGRLDHDMEAKLSRNLVKENADVFEKINEDEPVCLNNLYRCVNNYRLTKNTKKIWANESSEYYNNTLICLDIPTATQTILDLNKTPYRILPNESYYIPNDDGSILAMACFKKGQPHELPPFLIIYNSQATKEEEKFTEVMVLPTENIHFKSFCNNQIVAYNNHPNSPQELQTYFIDCDQKKITTTLPAELLAVSKSGTHIATYNSTQKIMTLYKSDGTEIGTFPSHQYAPAFTIDETKMATMVEKCAYIWDINTHTLLHEIHYPVHRVYELAFKNDHCIIATAYAYVMQDEQLTVSYKTYKTNLNTRHTRLLAESNSPIRTNHDGSLHVHESAADKKIVSLGSTTQQKNLRAYHSPTKICIFGPGFTNNNEYLLLTETGVNPFSAAELPWIKRYTTHRAITNTATVEELLALCIAERQKNTGLAVDDATQKILHNTQNQRIKEIAEKRYPQSSSTSCTIS